MRFPVLDGGFVHADPLARLALEQVQLESSFSDMVTDSS